MGRRLIESLRIESLAVVESADLELGPGLHVVTGETGAGKSLVLGAVALLAGGRADPESVRPGADAARVEAVLRVDAVPGLGRALDEQGLEVEAGGVTVQRTVAREGRSRARVAGVLMPAAALAQLFGEHLEVASQHESQALRRPETHGALLDAWSGLTDSRTRVEALVGEIRALEGELATLRTQAEERARREDFLAFQVRELDAASLREGEREELEREQGRLGHAERLREDAGVAAAALGGDPDAAEGGVVPLLALALRRLEGAAGHDSTLVPSLERLRSAELEVADLASELTAYAESIEADPKRLAAAEDRLALLDRLGRKYGANEAEMLEFRDRAEQELAALAGADERIAKLEGEGAQLRAQLEAEAKKLSDGRRRGAKRLERKLRTALGELALEGAAVRVDLTAREGPEGLPCGPSGAEVPEFLFSAHPDLPPRPLRRVASGGELSRIFLALKNTLRQAAPGGTLIFDEVDAGIGGAVADRIGAVLAELSADHQVLCITHLPQVAARATAHWSVRKDASGRAEVVRLDEAGRVEELARMAGGEKVTQATRSHARALRKAARTDEST
ncbi:MAG: DNA repair protein RecN [Myxococcota bacterium]